MSRRMILVASAAAAPLLAAVPVGAQKYADARPVAVAGPVVVAVTPPFTQEELDSGSDLAAALDDFLWYLAPSGKELERAGVAVQVRNTALLRLREPRGVHEIAAEAAMAGLGYVLAAPGRRPKLLSGVHTDLDLLEAAAEYFDLPALRPKGAGQASKSGGG